MGSTDSNAGELKFTKVNFKGLLVGAQSMDNAEQSMVNGKTGDARKYAAPMQDGLESTHTWI